MVVASSYQKMEESRWPDQKFPSLYRSKSFVPSAGQFYGTLFHDLNRSEQLITLNVLPNEKIFNDGRSYYRSVLSVQLGPEDSNETLVFKTDMYAGQSRLPKFIATQGNGFLFLKSWVNNNISADLYLKNFGMIGSLELKKNSKSMQNVDSTHLLRAISGKWETQEYELNLNVTSGISETSADFFSAKSRGILREKGFGKRRRNVHAVSFFYPTGHFALMLDDERIATGFLDGDKMNISIPGATTIGSVLDTQRILVFTRVSNETIATQLRETNRNPRRTTLRLRKFRRS